jgi:histidine triad (HIT) family protein
MASSAACVFCKIARHELAAYIVAETAAFMTFLDARPVFPGHCLVIPREHYETLADLPDDVAATLLPEVQRVARAVEAGLGADGSFIAINNRVSQSVPHLHIHVVPRRKKDGLKGFFWPRQKYASEEAAQRTCDQIRSAFMRS